ncbi:GRAA protein, partial [Dromas ardeola]|nr:GRAA protein [Dromas ardeola]
MTSDLLALLLSLIAVILPPRYGCTDIIGGRVVHPHSRPYMAALQRKNVTLCGGALVEKQWVLTAAHCELNKLEDRVVLGAHQPSKAEKEQQIFKVMHHFPHPQFNWSSKENDIMLLKVLYIKPGTTCKVAGWGLTSSKKPSKCLRETTLKIVDRKSCESKYGKNTKITSNMLCAVGKNTFQKADACKGDSGGPLICADQYSGIVSFGKGCGKRNMPGVYTRLTEEYIDWIKKKISLYRDQ